MTVAQGLIEGAISDGQGSAPMMMPFRQGEEHREAVSEWPTEMWPVSYDNSATLHYSATKVSQLTSLSRHLFT